MNPGRALACACILLAAWCREAGAWGWLAAARYEADSEELLSTLRGTAGVTGLETVFGSFDLLGEYRRDEILKNGFGLRDRAETMPMLRARYALLFGQYGLAAQAALGSLDGSPDYEAGADLSRYWLALGGVLKAKLSALDQVDKDNPILAALPLRARSGVASLNFALSPWTFELGGGMRFLEGVSNARVDAVVADTNQVSDLPENRIRSAYLYGYRGFGKWLLAGAFASYADSHRDFYALVNTTAPPQRKRTYMYFPYETPLDAFAAGAVIALTLEAGAAGSFTAKTTFPAWSTRRQSGTAWTTSGIIIPVWQGYYDFPGSEPATGELQWSLALPGGRSLVAAYRLFVKPYSEFGYFKEQAYRMHAFELRLGGS